MQSLPVEPCLGINGIVDTNKNFKTKDGMIKLDGKSSFKASFLKLV